MRRQMVTTMYNNKQLLDEVFVISRIIKVSVSVISFSLRLITLTSILIIPDITIFFFIDHFEKYTTSDSSLDLPKTPTDQL